MPFAASTSETLTNISGVRTSPMLSHINVGTRMDCTIEELAEKIACVVGFSGRIEFDASKPDGTLCKLLDVPRLEALLGCRAEKVLEAGCGNAYGWFKRNIEQKSLEKAVSKKEGVETIRILHMMLSNFYIDGYNYQENALPRQNLKDGHDVKIIASTETFITPHRLGYIAPSNYINKDGIEVLRIPYRKTLPHFVVKKVRTYPGVYSLIEDFSPDIIFFHGASAYELVTVLRYKKEHPAVRFLVDQHGDRYNSARNFLSREILHRRFYAPILRFVLPYIDKVFCISLDVMDFLNELYSIPKEKLEFFPLGGVVVPREELAERNQKIRREMRIDDSIVIMLHTGRMDKQKKTVELLQSFASVANKNARLWLAGSFHQEIETEATALIEKDKRIQYLGWKTPEEMLDILCATDIYLQPGTQSATMQNAMCAGCALMLYPYKSHQPFMRGNSFCVENELDMVDVFRSIKESPSKLKGMSILSHEIARSTLSYEVLANRMYTGSSSSPRDTIIA